MVIGTYLLYRGQEHLVFRDNILREKALEEIGRIPVLLLPSTDIWNFNAHHNSNQLDTAQRVAKSLGMGQDPINIVEGHYSPSGGKSNFASSDYHTRREVDPNAPLSSLIKRMLFYDGLKTGILFEGLKHAPSFGIEEQPMFPHSSELIESGFRHDQNVSRPERLTDVIIGLESSGKLVRVARDAFSTDGSLYKDAFAIYVK